MAYKSPEGPRAYGPQAFTAPCRRWKESPDGANHRRRLAPRPVARFFGLPSIKRLVEASIVANAPDPPIDGKSFGDRGRTSPAAASVVRSAPSRPPGSGEADGSRTRNWSWIVPESG